MRSEVKRIRQNLTKRVTEDQSWLYSKTEAGVWIRSTLDLIAGEIRVEYQPRVEFDRDTISVFDLDGRLEARLVRGISITDIPQDEWRVASSLDLALIDGLNVLTARDHLRAMKRIRDNMMLLIMLGYGQPAQEVASWFIQPSECAWVKPEVPYLVYSRELGLGSLQAEDVRCSICGDVTFSVSLLDDEVDFTLSWDRFLLSAEINLKGGIDEVY